MYRYRKLVGHLDWSAIGSVGAAGAGYSRHTYSWDSARAYHGSSNLPIVDAPRRVEVREGQASFDELAGMLGAGALRPEDLVEWDGAWVSFDRVYAFEDACALALRRRKRRQLAVVVATVLLGPWIAGGLLRGLIWLMIRQ